MDPNIMLLGYPGIHSTPLNQGLSPHLASHPYSASTIEGFAPLHECSATDPPYGTASAAYGTISAAYSLPVRPMVQVPLQVISPRAPGLLLTQSLL